MQLIRSICRSIRKRRDDEGSIVIVAILVVGLAMISTVAVTSVLNGINVASTATQGEQAVAQANGGLSDVLFRLDQMGTSPTSFCEGTPPSSGVSLPTGVTSWLPTGMSASDCTPSGGTQPPIPGAPDVVYAEATVQSSQQAHVVTVAVVGGQTRVVSTDIYQLVDDFGIYGLTSVNFDGTSKNKASIEEIDSQGVAIDNALANIDIGVGVRGSVTCNGGVGSGVYVIKGTGAVDSGCPPPSGVINVTPQDPQVCVGDEATDDGFAPCIDATSFATDAAGNPYCPIQGISDLVAGIDPASDAPATPPEGASSVYDCDTDGGSIDVTSTGSGQPIPAGSYYFTSESTQIGDIASGAFTNGPVSFFVLPVNCYGAGGPMGGSTAYTGGCTEATATNLPTSTSPNCAGGETPPSQSLTLTSSGKTGSDINVNGNPENFNLYWAGCGPVPVGEGNNSAVLTGNYYMPGAQVTADAKLAVTGSIVVGQLVANGTPTIHFVYAEHQARVLQSWTELNYHISP